MEWTDKIPTVPGWYPVIEFRGKWEYPQVKEIKLSVYDNRALFCDGRLPRDVSAWVGGKYKNIVLFGPKIEFPPMPDGWEEPE